MTRFTPIFYIKLGEEGQSKVYIEESAGVWHSMVGFKYFKVEKAINEVRSFEAKFYNVKAANKLWLKEKANIMFFAGETKILKGVIKKVEYGTAYTCTVYGNGEEVQLLDRDFKKGGESRHTYIDTSAQSIAKDALSVGVDGTAPWVITPAADGIFGADWGTISVKYENTNRLNVLNKLCDYIDYEWDVDTDVDDYDIATFKVSEYLPSETRATTSQGTFSISGPSLNCRSTTHERDTTNLANKITFLGAGDGINQLSFTAYNASASHSFLIVPINTTDNQITVADASSFVNTGEMRIGSERITYTSVFGNTFIGCARGANGTTAQNHKSGCFVEKYVSEASAESGSSISDNGLICETIVDKSITNLETAEIFASKELMARMDPIVRITVNPIKPNTALTNYQLGDLITIIDAESGINGDYRIVQINYDCNYGYTTVSFECSNRTLTFTERMQKEKERVENLSTNTQGATNVWSDTQTQNADSMRPLILQVKTPDDVENSTGTNKTNAITLSYKCSDYRTYTGALSGTTGNSQSNADIANVASKSNNTYANVASKSNNTYANAATTSNATFSNGAVSSDDALGGITSYPGTTIDYGTTEGIYTPNELTTSDTGYPLLYCWMAFEVATTTDFRIKCTVYAYEDSSWVSVSPTMQQEYNLNDGMTSYFGMIMPLELAGLTFTKLRVRYLFEYIAGTSGVCIDRGSGFYILGKHTHLNSFSDANHTNPNTFGDENHTNINTFGDENHTNINTFTDADHANPAGTLATDYSLGEEAPDATDCTIKIYNSSNILVWNSGSRGATEEEDVDITSYVKTPDWYRVEIQPNGNAMVYGTIKTKAGIE